MKTVFVDTSAHYALVDKNDPFHELARGFLEGTTTSEVALVTSNFIISEVYTLIMARLGRRIAIKYIEAIKKDALKRLYSIERVTIEDEENAWNILTHKEENYSYVDATSFALMKRLGLSVVFAFDRHFEIYGFNVVPVP